MILLALLSFLLNPTFYIVSDNNTKEGEWSICTQTGCKTAIIDDIECRMEEITFRGESAYSIAIRNTGTKAFTPEKAGLRLGIDTWMDTYPQWLEKWAPTYLSCEQDHFSGYLQTPSGRILGLFSPDPIASWSLDYNLGYPDPFWFYGHRISSVNLDIMNALPLPSHHPQNRWKLESGEAIFLILAVKELDCLDSFDMEKPRLTGAPSIALAKTNYSKGETVEIKVYGNVKKVDIFSPSKKNIKVRTSDSGIYRFVAKEEGDYLVTAASEERFSTGTVTVHRSWEYIFNSARDAAIKCPQKPTSHVESWYGFSSAFAAASVFPDKEKDEALDRRFDYIIKCIFNEDFVPYHYASRIQNTACTVGMFVDRFQAFSRIQDLEDASRMADWLISFSQAEDGAYMNHGVKYTSVIYVAKSILELSLAEREYGLQNNDQKWLTNADRHYQSAKRAIDQLVSANGDFQTEGEMTFEENCGVK